MRARGFTLIELAVTLSLVAVLGALAVPSFQSFISNSRFKAHFGAIQNSLMLARSEAIKRRIPVIVCKSSDQDTCTTSGGWEQGWIVLADENGSGIVDGARDGIIERVPALSGSFQLRGEGNAANFVAFSASGGASSVASGTVDEKLKLCRGEGGEGRVVGLLLTGRVTIVRDPAFTTCTPF